MGPRWCLLFALAALLKIRGEEEITFSQAPDGVVWIVQLSDLHVSVYHPNRAQDLETLASGFIKLVKPALVLVTGDLTDAKNRELTVTRQDEAEWIQYRQTMKRVAEKTGLPLHVFFDLRGNHDKFGVPLVGGELDFFSNYSLSAYMNRREDVQHVTVAVPGGWKYLFLGFDDTMPIGLRGPTNLFGHPTDAMLSKIDSVLETFNKQSPQRSAKIVFGHFPMSFTTSTESGKRPEEVFAKRGVSAYLCGHLHTKFGKQLYKLHSYKTDVNSRLREFWEWEMGDWRGSRAIRILAVDNGHTSFVDTRLDNLNSTATVILPTYPLDSRFMKKNPAYAGDDEEHGDSIRALVFSKQKVASITAQIYDTKGRSRRLVDALEMHSVWRPKQKAYLFKTSWRRNRYADPSPLRYWLEIVVVDTSGRQTVSIPKPFSVNGRVSQLSWKPSEFLVMGVQWADVYPTLFWLNIGLVLGAELLLPRLFYVYLERKRRYRTFVSAVLNRKLNDGLKLLLKFSAWVFMENSRNLSLWSGQVLLMVSLLFFPWFWGLPFGDSYRVGYLTYRGWQVDGNRGLGAPDLIVIVLPFLYIVVLPLTLVLACMSAERAASELHHCLHRKVSSNSKPIGTTAPVGPGRKKLNEKPPDSGLLQLLEKEVLCLEEVQSEPCRMCSRWLRKPLYVACLVIGWLHWRQCYWLAAAYGPLVLASPSFAFSIPLLMMFTIYQTSSIRDSKVHSAD